MPKISCSIAPAECVPPPVGACPPVVQTPAASRHRHFLPTQYYPTENRVAFCLSKDLSLNQSRSHDVRLLLYVVCRPLLETTIAGGSKTSGQRVHF